MTPHPRRLSALGAALRRGFGADLRSLAACRMALAGILLVDLALRARFLSFWYSDAGAVPREAVRRATGDDTWLVLPHFAAGSTWFAAALFLLHGLVVLALALGWRTRLASLLAFGLTLSLHLRNPTINQAGDVMLRMALFWGCFLPWGAVWSLDARRRPPPAERGLWVATAATAAFLLQLASVYWVTAFLKLSPPWLGHGSAVWMALHVDGFATDLGVWMRGLPVAWLTAMTWATMAVEFVGPFLIFISLRGRLRVVAFVLFAGLHLTMGAALSLGSFRWIPVALWLAVLPGWCWDALGARLRTAMPAVGHGWPLGRGATAAVVGLMLVLSWQNAGTISPALEPPGPVMRLLRSAGLAQRWSMFAPHPGRTDGWLVAQATWPDGRTRDLMHGGPVRWDKPRRIAATLPDQFFRKYMIELHTAPRATYRPYLSRHLCRAGFPFVRQANAPDQRPEIVELYWVMELTLFDWAVARPAPLLLDLRRCNDPTDSLEPLPQPILPLLDPG